MRHTVFQSLEGRFELQSYLRVHTLHMVSCTQVAVTGIHTLATSAEKPKNGASKSEMSSSRKCAPSTLDCSATLVHGRA